MKMVEDNHLRETFGDIKYFVGGGYSSISSNNKSNNPLQDNFLQIFNNKSLNEVPDAKNIKIIWAFMNYYLNFEPFGRSIKDKIDQNYKWMNYVSDVVAKNDPIAIYYKMIMQKKHQGFYEKIDVDRFKT